MREKIQEKTTNDGIKANRCEVRNETLPPGYVLLGAPPIGFVVAARASGVKCAAGFTGTVLYQCPTNGSAFAVLGCAGTHTTYFSSEISSSPHLYANISLSSFSSVWGTVNNCSLPPTLPPTHQMNGSCTGLRNVSECVEQVTCGPGYSGTPRLQCLNDGDTFVMRGCSGQRLLNFNKLSH